MTRNVGAAVLFDARALGTQGEGPVAQAVEAVLADLDEGAAWARPPPPTLPPSASWPRPSTTIAAGLTSPPTPWLGPLDN